MLLVSEHGEGRLRIRIPRLAQRTRQCAASTALLIALGMMSACDASGPEAVPRADAAERSTPWYEFGPPSRDGIGKFYMGREISQVMGHRGAGWLERPNRERAERTDLLVKNLPLKPDSVVADIGAGTGYFSFRIARRIPDGTVYAVDIQQEMLEIIESRIEEGSPGRVKTVRGTEQDPRLPSSAIDLILLVDAYHEFSYPREMGEAMVRALRPGGQLVLIEYKSEDPSVTIKPLHKMSAVQAKREMQALGLEWERTEDFLPQQHFLVFRRPATAAPAQ